MKAHEFIEYFKKYCATLNGDGMPEIKTIYEVTSEFHNHKIFKKSQQYYAGRMTRTVLRLIIANSKNSEIRLQHEMIKTESRVLFEALLETTSAFNFKEKLDEF